MTVSLISNASLTDNGDYVSDSKTGLDWLKLDILNGYSYEAVDAGALGYTTSGWRFASKDDLLNLITTYVGPATGKYPGFFSSDWSSEIFEATNYLVPLFGMNIAFNDSRAAYNLSGGDFELHQISVQGFFKSSNFSELAGLGEITAVISVSADAPPGPFPVPSGRWLVYDNFFSGSLAQGPNLSSFLVRTTSSVPEPSKLSLFFFCIFITLFVRFKHSVIPDYRARPLDLPH